MSFNFSNILHQRVYKTGKNRTTFSQTFQSLANNLSKVSKRFRSITGRWTPLWLWRTPHSMPSGFKQGHSFFSFKHNILFQILKFTTKHFYFNFNFSRSESTVFPDSLIIHHSGGATAVHCHLEWD